MTQRFDGNRREIPAGTLLFGKRRLNQLNKRMEAGITSGVTPDGREFTLSATVYDNTRVAGLAGVVIRDREAQARGAVRAGIVDAARGVLDAVVDASPVSSGVKSGAESVLRHEADQTQRITSLIQVSPQAVLIRVDETF